MALKQNKDYVKVRINRLKIKPVENARLIKKWERKLRRIEKDEMPIS